MANEWKDVQHHLFNLKKGKLKNKEILGFFFPSRLGKINGIIPRVSEGVAKKEGQHIEVIWK